MNLAAHSFWYQQSLEHSTKTNAFFDVSVSPLACIWAGHVATGQAEAPTRANSAGRCSGPGRRSGGRSSESSAGTRHSGGLARIWTEGNEEEQTEWIDNVYILIV